LSSHEKNNPPLDVASVLQNDGAFLAELKERIRAVQLRASLSVTGVSIVVIDNVIRRLDSTSLCMGALLADRC